MIRAEGAFIIHLARAEARKPQVARLLSDLPVTAEILDAVDGRSAPAEVLSAYDPARRLSPAYPFPLVPGEIACFLSHRAAWAQVVARGWSAGLLIEDDAALDPEVFARAMALAEAEPGDGIVQFQTRAAKTQGPVIAQDGPVALSQPDLVPLRTTCSLYSNAACARLLAVTERFDRPLDVMIQMHWVTGLRARVLWPSGVTEASDAVGGTTIQKKGRGVLDRLNRELRRPLFRAAMARAARRG